MIGLRIKMNTLVISRGECNLSNTIVYIVTLCSYLLIKEGTDLSPNAQEAAQMRAVRAVSTPRSLEAIGLAGKSNH